MKTSVNLRNIGLLKMANRIGISIENYHLPVVAVPLEDWAIWKSGLKFKSLIVSQLRWLILCRRDNSKKVFCQGLAQGKQEERGEF